MADISSREGTYCQAEFWRPTGLGNRLFSWARADIYSRTTGSIMLAPQWAHFRGGSISRGGIDYSNALRKILLFDNFKPAPGQITGIKKLLIRSSAKKIPVLTIPDAFKTASEKNSIVTFQGHMAHVFDDLWQYQTEIAKSLREITLQKWLDYPALINKPFIAINVRLGNDFRKIAENGNFVDTPGYLQTPLTWYADTLKEIRKVINLPAVIISDGSAADLKPLLDQPETSLGSSPSAIGDLMILSKASLLLGAGRSSFSAWASFLAKIPTVSIPGSNLQSFNISDDLAEHFVGEFDPGKNNDAFLQALSTLN